MPISQIIKQKCKVCGALAEEISRINFGSSKLITLKCGHLVSEEVLASVDYDSIVSNDGHKLFPYQIECIKFLEKANGKAIIADEQALGKTVEVSAFLKLHSQTTYPAVIVTKSGVKLQWMWELFRWIGSDTKIQVVFSGKEIAVPGFDFYITTYDMIKEEQVWQFVKDSIKTIVFDECQTIKNHLSQRAKAAQSFAKACEYVIPMSGTPVENHAGEYFTVLNMVQPKLFPEMTRFLREDCESYETNFGYRVGGLANPKQFKEKTKDFIIRRLKKDVLSDLPPKIRAFHHVELDARYNPAYAAAFKELEAIYYADKQEMEHILAIYSKMRKICGLSKVTECVEFVADHIVSTGRKIVIAVHHHSTASLLDIKLKQWLEPLGYRPALKYSSDLNDFQRQDVVNTFRDDPLSLILIASTKAMGTGLNLQFCSDAIMLERQWNPKIEEQFEDRFHRKGLVNPLTITYFLASGMIDDLFTILCEQKRGYSASAMGDEQIIWNQQSLVTELMSMIIAKGAKPWSL